MDDLNVVLFEDDLWQGFYPLTLTRPLWDLRVGMLTLFEKWRALVSDERLYVHTLRETVLQVFLEQVRGARAFPSEGRELPESLVLVNARWLPPEPEELRLLLAHLRVGEGWSRKGRVVLAHLALEQAHEVFQQQGHLDLEEAPDNFRVMEHPGHLFHWHTEEFLLDDIRRELPRGIHGRILGTPYIMGDAVYIGPASEIHPSVVIDSREGPVYIGEHVLIEGNVFIRGPVFVGAHSRIKAGTRLYEGVSLGPVSRVAGELSMTVFQGYSNKQHEGFLGHTLVGEWVNFGAHTTGSNLKHTYSEVRLRHHGQVIPTGERFFGALIGDHTKIGIQSMLRTGAVLGVNVSFFGGGFCPPWIPSFVWGGPEEGYTEYRLDRALDVAAVVMERRSRVLRPSHKRLLREVFEEEASARRAWLREHG